MGQCSGVAASRQTVLCNIRHNVIFHLFIWWFALFLLPLQHENKYNEYYYILHNLCSRNEENGVVYNIALGL